MAYTDNDRIMLQDRIVAIGDWLNLYCADRVNVASGATQQILQNDIHEIRRIRWFSVASVNELATIWYRFVENEDLEGEGREGVFDFYTQGVTYMEMMAPIASGHLESFLAHVAKAVTWPERSVVVSDIVRDNASSYENVLTMLKGNPWVVFMIILGMMPTKV
ncbi:hypothetical protein D3C85_13730 [compost metagenome]